MRKSIVPLRFLCSEGFILPFEGEEEPKNTGSNDGGSSTGNDSDDTDDLPPAAKGKTTFNQEELNRILKEDRKKHQQQLERQRQETQKQIDALEKLQKSKTLSDNDRKLLESQIEDLKNGQLTAKELAAKEKEKLQRSHQETVTKLTGERDAWQTRFTTSVINTAIVSSAAQAEAFDPDALIALLGPNTRIAEDTDDEGKGLGTFTPKVKFQDKDKDDKTVTLDLTVEQAIKRMKEIPKYGYLFKTTAASGLGANGGTGRPAGPVDVAKMSPEQYREYRKKQGLGRSSN